MLRVALQGGNLYKFELAYDSVDLIGIVFQQLKRIKIEKYEPILIAGKTDQKPVDTVGTKINETTNSDQLVNQQINEKPKVSFSTAMIDHHNLSIATMGDIENYLRQKFK